eukprot:9971521-Lingulodinium_polyedra.AAC.1
MENLSGDVVVGRATAPGVEVAQRRLPLLEGGHGGGWHPQAGHGGGGQLQECAKGGVEAGAGGL